MTHPLLRLVVSQPQLLVDHAAAYAEFLSTELASACASWRQQMLMTLAIVSCLGVGAALAGVAWMLWAMLPPAPGQLLWPLLVAPAVPCLLALGLLIKASRNHAPGAMDQVKLQLAQDIAMMRDMGAR
jgi:hypothetical protein